jgi:integrase
VASLLIGVSKDGVRIFGPVKDKKSRPRTILLDDEVMAVLVEHVRVFGLRPDGLLFTNENGEPIWRSTWSDNWTKVARPPGIEVGERALPSPPKLLRPMFLRHGGNIFFLQQVLGHADIRTTQIYSQLTPDSDEVVRTAMGAVMRSLHSALPETKRKRRWAQCGRTKCPIRTIPRQSRY